MFGDNVPCRYVIQERVSQLQFPFSESVAWITVDAIDLAGPSALVASPGVVHTDYGRSDRVQVSSEPTTFYVVVRGELVEPWKSDSYVRYLLVPPAVIGYLPPAEPFCGPGTSGGYEWHCPGTDGIWVFERRLNVEPGGVYCRDPGPPPFANPPQFAEAFFSCPTCFWFRSPSSWPGDNG
jgi:hypothetical protein